MKQYICYGSPACDLNFFLNTSPKLQLLQECHEEQIPRTLEYGRFEDLPTYEDLQLELRSREVYGLFAFLPMISMP